MTLNAFIPLGIIITGNMIIIFHITSNHRPRNDTDQQPEMKVVSILIINSLFFIICSVPFYVINMPWFLLFDLDEESSLTIYSTKYDVLDQVNFFYSSNSIITILFHILVVPRCLSPFLNFIMYALVGSLFRKAFTDLFCGCCPDRH